MKINVVKSRTKYIDFWDIHMKTVSISERPSLLQSGLHTTPFQNHLYKALLIVTNAKHKKNRKKETDPS